MSEDKPAETVENTPAEASAIPNGKGHEPGEEISASAKTPLAEDGEKWVYYRLLQCTLVSIMHNDIQQYLTSCFHFRDNYVVDVHFFCKGKMSCVFTFNKQILNNISVWGHLEATVTEVGI